jgi:hypothetical protein
MNSWAPASLAACHHRFQRQAGVGQGDVLADGAAEQHVLLQHDADLAAQAPAVGQGQIDAIDQHATTFGQVEALGEFRQGAFTRTGTANDADDFAGFECRALILRSTSGPSGR